MKMMNIKIRQAQQLSPPKNDVPTTVKTPTNTISSAIPLKCNTSRLNQSLIPTLYQFSTSMT